MLEPAITLHSFANVEAVNQAAARLLTKLAQEAVAKHGRFSIALSGGGTPSGVYDVWGKRPFRDEMPWLQTHLFWGDERLVPPDDPGSNYGQVANLLLKNVPILPENIHRARGELEMAAAVADYINQLKTYTNDNQIPILDVVLLGLGSDGHTASLFPGSPINQPEWVMGVTADYNGRPAQRLTLTPKLINCARQVIFLVTGSGKAAALHQTLYGPRRPGQLPAQRIRPTNGQLTWLTDEAAARDISQLTQFQNNL